jgi:hypothetical protein
VQPLPTHIKVLDGAAPILCGQRQLCGKNITNPAHYKKRMDNGKDVSEAYYKNRTTQGYHTNRSIKTWACYFLLKSLTTSGVIQRWTSQRLMLLDFTKMNENSLRTRLAEMKALGLCTISKHSKNIQLVSFEKAADILDIVYTGTIEIEYKTNTDAKQIFQYQLRGEDVRLNQAAQLEQLIKKVNKNPLLKSQLIVLLQQQFGCTEKQLRQHTFFQQKLLHLQQITFTNGSALYTIIHQLRADVNRGVDKIQQQHNYKCPTSVSYMKSIMKKYGVVAIEKKHIDSKPGIRSRKFLPDGKEGYKWIEAKMSTQWVLTDQLTLLYKTIVQPPKIKPEEKKKQNQMKKAA